MTDERNLDDGSSNKALVEGSRSNLPSKERKAPAQNLNSAASDDEVPTRVEGYVKGGLLFLVLTLGMFSAWAALAPLSSAIVGVGEVVVESNRRSIQHLEGGIIEQLHVRDGDRVEAGDPLIQLQTTKWQAEREITRKRLFSTRATLERLQQEQAVIQQITEEQLLDWLSLPPLEFSEALQEEAERDADIASVIQQQQQLYRSRLIILLQQQQGLTTRMDQTREQIAGIEGQLDILEELIEATEEERQAFATLFEEGLADGQRARDLRRTLLERQNQKAALSTDMARFRLAITETELERNAQREGFLREVGEQTRQTQSDLFDLQERLQVATDALDRATIVAPDDGTVIDMQVHTIGSVARPGQPLLDLVPNEEFFVVETRIEPKDVDQLYEGQLADIRFSAFNQRLTKIIEGEVVNISADRLEDPDNGAPYYQVRLRVTERGSADMNEDMDLKPGMPAEVMIRRQDRTMFSYLMKPISDGLARSLREE